jgi:hypothetical protein
VKSIEIEGRLCYSLSISLFKSQGIDLIVTLITLLNCTIYFCLQIATAAIMTKNKIPQCLLILVSLAAAVAASLAS